MIYVYDTLIFLKKRCNTYIIWSTQQRRRRKNIEYIFSKEHGDEFASHVWIGLFLGKTKGHDYYLYK